MKKILYFGVSVAGFIILVATMNILVTGILGNVVTRNSVSSVLALEELDSSNSSNELYSYYTIDRNLIQPYIRFKIKKETENIFLVDGEKAAKQDLLVHNVIDGDTLSLISSKYGVSVDLLIEQNHILNPNLIYAGSSLQIPFSE